MLIYNTTFVVSKSHIAQWQSWLEQTFNPAIGSLMVTSGVEVFEVLSISDEVSSTFSVQWRFFLHEHLEEIEDVSNEQLSKLPALFGENCLHFSSVLRQYPLN